MTYFTSLLFLCLFNSAVAVAAKEQAGSSYLVAAGKTPSKKVRKKASPKTPIDAESEKPPTASGTPSSTTVLNSGDIQEPVPTSAEQSDYVSLRSVSNVGDYSVELMKAKKREVSLLGGYSVENSQESGVSDITKKTSANTSALGVQLIFPIGKISFAPGLAYLTGDSTSKTDASDPTDVNEVKAKLSQSGIGIVVGIHATSLIDLGLSLSRSDQKIDITYASQTSTGSALNLRAIQKYSYTTSILSLGLHRSAFESSVSYEPGKTVTGTQDLTINDSSQDSGKDPKTENPTTLKLQGRFLFTPTAFAGLQLQSDSAPNKKGSKYGIEAAYILKSVQLGTLLSIDAAKNTKDDSEDNADNKSTEINFSADFKSDSNQTFSVGSTYENSTSANHTSSSDSTTKGSRIGFNAGGYIRF